MDCEAEEQFVRMCLDNLDGVDRISVDLDRRAVAIEHDLEIVTLEDALQRLDLGVTYVAVLRTSPRTLSRESNAGCW